MKSNKTNTEEKRQEEENKTADSAPKYITTKPEFYCPLAPTIMWHHGLYYSDCPLTASQRDMSSCNGCKLRWVGVDKTKATKKEKNSYNKSEQRVDKNHREETPIIGKTYSSDNVD